MPRRLLLVLSLLVLIAHWDRPAQAADKSTPLHFAFWYEPWRPDSWAKLQPAKVIIGVPPEAVPDIHAHGGRALRYVTFYQGRFGTAFLRDQSDLENVGFHTPAGNLPSAFGGSNNYVLCSNSVELRRRILAYIEETLKKDSYDGLFVDNAYLAPASELVCDAAHAHSSPGLNGGPAYVALLAAVRVAIKKQNPQAIVMVNPGNPRDADQLVYGVKSLWDEADYVLWESYGFSSLLEKGHDRWESTLAQSKQLASSPHASKIVALSYPRTDAEALYSFAIARAFGFAYAANLGEHDFQRQQEGGHFGVFLGRLPLELGPPAGPVNAGNGSAVLQRKFRNGEAIINTGATGFHWKVPSAGTVYTDGAHSRIAAGKELIVAGHHALIVTFR